MKFPIVTRFAVLSLLCVIALAVAMGLALSALLTRAVSEWEWENTAAFVRREVEIGGLDTLFTAPQGPETQARWATELSRRFAGLPEVVRVKAWDRTATVLWSDEARLIGQRFPDNQELQESLAGEVAVEIKALNKAEQAYERAGFATLAEIYVPILSKGAREVVGVLEVYKTPVRLLATIRWGRVVIWTISLAGGLALYAVLLPLARQVYGREVREVTLQAYAGRLEQEVAERTRALERQTEQLIQAQKMEAVGLLAGGVAHDFNNLLTVILGRSAMLRHHLGLDNPLRKHVDLIQQTGESAAALTRQLLAFSRKQVFQMTVLDLNGIVAELEPMLRRLIGEDIVLVTVLEALAPVTADPAQLEQVILNLVVNARDAMPQGGRLTVTTANVQLDDAFTRNHPGARPGRCVRLAVGDSGVGMDADTQARVFEPFFTTKGPGKGTGLGLAVVYGIVKQHQGYIAVESDPGRGATFTVYLPQAHEVTGRVEARQVRLALPRGSETVLVVEDEEGVRDLAREVLQMHGYTILEARLGAEALLVCERHRGSIHLLLADVVMPEMSGRELAQRVVAVRPETTVLYMSGHTDAALGHYGVLEPGTKLLQKPFTPETLVRTVRDALDASRERPR